MMLIHLALLLPRDAASVPLARHTVSAALRSARVDADCVADVALALTEACTNVFRHSGHDRNYEVMIDLAADRLTMDVLDLGSGFGQRATTDAEMPGPEAESGRGLALMEAFSDRAVFDAVTGEGTSVHLVKYLRWAQPTPSVAADGPAGSTANGGGSLGVDSSTRTASRTDVPPQATRRLR